MVDLLRADPDSTSSSLAASSDSTAPSQSLQSFLVKHMVRPHTLCCSRALLRFSLSLIHSPAFLLCLQEKYNANLTEKHHKLYNDISSLKDTMTENVDLLLERGEKIDLLVDKSDILQGQSVTFQKSSKKLKDEMWSEKHATSERAVDQG